MYAVAVIFADEPNARSVRFEVSVKNAVVSGFTGCSRKKTAQSLKQSQKHAIFRKLFSSKVNFNLKHEKWQRP